MAPADQHSHQFMMNMLLRTVFLIIEIIIINYCCFTHVNP
jgi:hypothetical protein